MYSPQVSASTAQDSLSLGFVWDSQGTKVSRRGKKKGRSQVAEVAWASVRRNAFLASVSAR